ncbi:hypothetical protein PSPO01_12936 [Paraphaeosphaeria sporulosa]
MQTFYCWGVDALPRSCKWSLRISFDELDETPEIAGFDSGWWLQRNAALFRSLLDICVWASNWEMHPSFPGNMLGDNLFPEERWWKIKKRHGKAKHLQLHACNKDFCIPTLLKSAKYRPLGSRPSSRCILDKDFKTDGGKEK